LLRQIERAEFGVNNPLLKRFRLLDTPGLGSIHHADSENTLLALGVEGFLEPDEAQHLEKVLGEVARSATDLHRDCLRAIDRADAVVYLFDRAPPGPG
jgi:nucleoside 2-deoxyribosyltransferase